MVEGDKRVDTFMENMRRVIPKMTDSEIERLSAFLEGLAFRTDILEKHKGA